MTDSCRAIPVIEERMSSICEGRTLGNLAWLSLPILDFGRELEVPLLPA